MPNRILRESILTSDRVDQLSAVEEVFYRRLMSVVDDFGRFDARPKVLRAGCYPLKAGEVREADITRWMAACQKAGLIALYEVAGKPYGVLWNLGKARAEKSNFPDPPREIGPPDSARTCAQMRADESGCAQTQADVPYSYSGPNSYSEECSEPGSAGTLPPSFPIFPCVKGRKSDLKRWELTEDQMREWSGVFPGVDVKAECRKAHAWVMANAAKRKTAGGMPDFLRRWLSKAQNDAGRKRPNGHGPGADDSGFVRREMTPEEIAEFEAFYRQEEPRP